MISVLVNIKLFAPHCFRLIRNKKTIRRKDIKHFLKKTQIITLFFQFMSKLLTIFHKYICNSIFVICKNHKKFCTILQIHQKKSKIQFCLCYFLRGEISFLLLEINNLILENEFSNVEIFFGSGRKFWEFFPMKSAIICY